MVDFSSVVEVLESLISEETEKMILRQNWQKISTENKLHLINEFVNLQGFDFIDLIYRSLLENKQKKFAAKVKNYSRFPYKTVWKSAEHDIPVTVTGVMGISEGVVYYSILESNAGIPENELVI